MNIRRYLIPLILIIFVGFGSIRPLLNSGFFPMHDDTQVGRVVVMGKALRNGQFPVRWVNDLGYGYGYPIFNFYGPLPYYAGGSLYALGVSGLDSTKIMIAIGVIGSAMTFYVFLLPFLGITASFVGAILYLYAPYHAVQTYVRGAVGELWTSIFFPLFLFGLLSYQRKLSNRLAILLGSVGLTGIILSHTIIGFVTVFLVGIGLAIYSIILLFQNRFSHIIFYIFQDKIFRIYISILFLGLALSAFFWIPAIFEMSSTAVQAQIGLTTANYKDHFVCLSQLWNSPWGFGGSIPGCIDGLSFKLGKIHILLAIVSLIIWFWNKDRNKLSRGIFLYASIITIVSIFFMLRISEPIWSIIPGFSYIQYPWRFLVFSMLGLSMLGAYSVSTVQHRFVRVILCLVITLVVFTINSKVFSPQYIYNRASQEFENEKELKWRVSKISDEYLPPDFTRPTTIDGIAQNFIEQKETRSIETVIHTETYTKVFIALALDENVRLAQAYFPGWKYFIDGKQIFPSIADGRPILSIARGEHVLEIQFINTWVRSVANIVSIVAIIGALYFSSYGKKSIT